MEKRDRLYVFKYKEWGVSKSETKKFQSMRQAVDYAVIDLPKKGYQDIQPPVEIDYLKH